MSQEGDRTIGEIVDGLGCELQLDDDEMITDAIVILKTVDGDGDVSLVSRFSAGMSWIERIGMLDVAAMMQREQLKGRRPE